MSIIHVVILMLFHYELLVAIQILSTLSQPPIISGGVPSVPNVIPILIVLIPKLIDAGYQFIGLTQGFWSFQLSISQSIAYTPILINKFDPPIG